MTLTTGARFLEGLKRAGIDTVYAIAGTDFAPLIEAWADPDRRDSVPAPVLVGHESVAVGMAHGAWLATGRPQAVAVHVSVGTANAVCAVINAARDRMPLVFMAGRTPLTEAGQHGSRNVHIHWGQELFDQAGVLREAIKWDYELRHGNPADAVAARAVALAAAAPSAPVYLSLPREVLAAPVTGDPAPVAPVPTNPRADAAAVARVARLLAKATFPLIVTSAAGFDPGVPALLGEVARTYGAGVVERVARGMNLGDDHPNHLGHRPDALLPDADVVIVLESDVPWFPGGVCPGDDATVVHVGVDPSFASYPLRTHRADLAVTADIGSFLADLLAAAPARAPKRSAKLAEHRNRYLRAIEAERASDERQGEMITKVTLMRALSDAIDADTVVVNEYPMARDHVPRTKPGTWLQHSPAAGLGWGLPAALGVQHARPDATVVATVGDGAYLFANPAACHHAAAAHQLPVVTVIATNRRWDAVGWSTLGLYPEGHAAAAGAKGAMPLVSLEPVPQFARYCEASGGWGTTVEQRSELAPALAEALRVARQERRQALVDVRCA